MRDGSLPAQRGMPVCIVSGRGGYVLWNGHNPNPNPKYPPKGMYLGYFEVRSLSRQETKKFKKMGIVRPNFRIAAPSFSELGSLAIQPNVDFCCRSCIRIALLLTDRVSKADLDHLRRTSRGSLKQACLGRTSLMMTSPQATLLSLVCVTDKVNFSTLSLPPRVTAMEHRGAVLVRKKNIRRSFIVFLQI